MDIPLGPKFSGSQIARLACALTLGLGAVKDHE
jgi:hypothetical protein